jgi:hypothetical protein
MKEWLNRKNTCPNCKDKVCEHFPEEMRRLQPEESSQRFRLDDSEQVSDDSGEEYRIGRENRRPMFGSERRFLPFHPVGFPRPMAAELN